MDASVNEPILRSPPIVLGLCAAFVIVHGLVFTLEMTDVLWVFSVFSFIPAQLGEGVKALANLVSFAFFHGSWEHVILNTLWLLVFGTPVAVRLETPARFIGLFLLTSVVSGLTHYVFHADSAVPLVGASGGVAGMFGAATRFALPGVSWLNPDQARKKLPLMPLRQTLSRRPVLVFIAVWMALNVVSGVSGLSPSGQSVSIAWQAHIGGFVAGLLLLPCFEKPPVSPSGGPGNVEYGRWAGS
ncbi:MAG: rhomboid family intramembrane serine protease [Parvibaculales bacterium]